MIYYSERNSTKTGVLLLLAITLLFLTCACENGRLEVTIAKIQQSLPETKRDGNTMVTALSESLLFSPASTSRASAVLELMEFIPRVAETLRTRPEEVIRNLQSLRQYRKFPCI